jgi:hypothetical protein
LRKYSDLVAVQDARRAQKGLAMADQEIGETVGRAEAHMQTVHLGRGNEDADVMIKRADWEIVRKYLDEADKDKELLRTNMTVGKLVKSIRRIATGSIDYVDGETIRTAVTLKHAEIQERLNKASEKARRMKRNEERRGVDLEEARLKDREREERLTVRQEKYRCYLAGYADLKTTVSGAEEHLAFALGVSDRKRNNEEPDSFTSLTNRLSKHMQ